MPNKSLATAAAVALLASCTPNDPTDLVVRRTGVYWSLDGSRTENPLPAIPVDVLVEAADGYTAIPMDQVQDGVYRLPTLPDGRFFVRQKVSASYTTLHQGSGGEFFLGQQRIARLGATSVQASTPITITATGVDAWQANDLLDFFSPSLDMHPTVASSGTEGETTATGTANLYTYPYYALDASKGDYAIVSQLRRSDVGAATVRKMIKYGEVAATTPAGQSTSIPATLASPSAARAVRLDLRASEFADVVAACGVAASSATYSASVGWHPLADVPGPMLSYRPNLVWVSSADDVDLGTVAVPLPHAGWGTIATATASASLATPNGPMNMVVSTVRYVADGSTPPLRPNIGPPRNLEVAGQALSGSPVTGVGLTPVLAWDAPAWGTPTAYSVNVYRAGSIAFFALVRSGRQVRIPPDVLVAGNTYWVSVMAWWAPNYRPNGISSFPYAGATAYSATTFTP